MTTWLEAHWAESRVGLREERLANDLEPGYPAWPWPSSYGPVSFVAAARERLPKVFNLNNVHNDVLRLYGLER